MKCNILSVNEPPPGWTISELCPWCSAKGDLVSTISSVFYNLTKHAIRLRKLPPASRPASRPPRSDQENTVCYEYFHSEWRTTPDSMLLVQCVVDRYLSTRSASVPCRSVQYFLCSRWRLRSGEVYPDEPSMVLRHLDVGGSICGGIWGRKFQRTFERRLKLVEKRH